MLLSIVPVVATSLLQPAFAWFAKVFIDSLSAGGGRVEPARLVAWIPTASGAFAALASLKFVEKIVNRIFDERLLIDLQRAYHRSRIERGEAEDVARMLNDCDRARKFFDLLQSDLWMFVVGVSAVLLWQKEVAPAWVPALLLAIVPTVLVSVAIGAVVRRLYGRVLERTVDVVAASGGADVEALHGAQELLYKAKMRCEWWKQSSEALAEAAQWGGVAVVLVAAALSAPILPASATPGEAAMFWGNLAIITRHASEMTKFLNKASESYPALVRVLRPAWES